MNSVETQETLAKAIELLKAERQVQENKSFNEVNVVKLSILILSLESVKLLSESGNSIPGLRGMGLEEAIAAAENLVENGINTRNISIQHRALFSGITLSNEFPAEKSEILQEVVSDQKVNPFYKVLISAKDKFFGFFVN